MARTADPRVAVLEEIAAATRSTLVEIRDDARGLRSEINQRLSGEIGGLRNDMNQCLATLDGHLWSSFLWLLGVIFAGYGALFYLIARGFKWL
jgi:hypothetical protein